MAPLVAHRPLGSSSGTSCGALPVVLLLVAGMSACSGPHRRPDDALGAPSEVYTVLDAREAQVADVRLKAKADYWDQDRGERVVGREISISARAPASLRVTISSFGKALASLASDGEQFAMLDLQEDRYYYGPATPENLSKLVPLFLSGTDFVRVLRGGFPEDDLADGWRDHGELGWNADTGRYRLVLPRRDGAEQVVELTHPALAVAEIRIRRGGEDVYVYLGKEFSVVSVPAQGAPSGVPVPMKSRFEIVADEVDVTLWVEQYDVNVQPPPPDALFTIKQPRSAEPVYLGE